MKMRLVVGLVIIELVPYQPFLHE